MVQIIQLFGGHGYVVSHPSFQNECFVFLKSKRIWQFGYWYW
jgi:hypothetical protein